MAKSEDPGVDDETERKREEFRQIVRDEFSPWTKSRQYKRDHPDSDWEKGGNNGPGDPPAGEPHNDGESIYQLFSLEPLPDYLERAARLQHPVAQHPKALAHFLTHIKQWEKWELGEDDPEFGDIPDKRRDLFDWYLGFDKDDPEEREEAHNRRMKRLRPGGTGVVMHGEQGTTKTTGMYWLIANMMEVNPHENVIWQSTLDDTEWQIFAPWATVLFPSGVDVKVTVNPHKREYRDVGEFEIEKDAIARQVIRYDDFDDMMEIMSNRTDGQIYVVYPDPKFRQCGTLTGYSYESIWDVESSEDKTPLGHYWFGLMEAIRQTNTYNAWTTLAADEAHKWLRHGKGNDEHDWWDKIEEWATYWGDARKNRLSVILSVHKWTEISSMVRDKVRWGVTMNGEDFPNDAPLDGSNKYDQDLGDFCIWNNLEWNHTGYPDIKRNFSVPADIKVSYPGFEEEKDAKS